MKDDKKWTLRLTGEQDAKIEYIAKKQARTKHMQVIFMIETFIADYEKVNGKIEINDEEREDKFRIKKDYKL